MQANAGHCPGPVGVCFGDSGLHTEKWMVLAGVRSTGAVSSLNGSFYINIQTASQIRRDWHSELIQKRIFFSLKVFKHLSLQPCVLSPT